MPEYFLEQQPVRELVHDYPVSFFKEKKVSKVIPTGKKRGKIKSMIQQRNNGFILGRF